MKRLDALKLLFNGVLIILLFLLQSAYYKLTSMMHLSEKFEKHLYFVVISTAILAFLRRGVILWYRWRNPGKKADNLIVGTGLITRVFHVAFAIVLALSFFNVSLGQAFTSISLIAVAFTLITKDYISNTLNGMILAFSDHLQIDDNVSIGEIKGKIQAITLAHVHLLTDDDDLVFIPNNMVYSSQVINYTRREIKKSSLDFEIDPGKIGDLDKLEQEIIGRMAPVSEHIRRETMTLKVVQLRKEAISLKFQYELHDPSNKALEKQTRRFCARRLAEIMHATGSSDN